MLLMRTDRRLHLLTLLRLPDTRLAAPAPVLHTTYPRRSNPERPHQMHTRMRIWWRRGESNPRVASVVVMLQRIKSLLLPRRAASDSRGHSHGQTIFKVLSRQPLRWSLKEPVVSGLRPRPKQRRTTVLDQNHRTRRYVI